MRSKMDYVPTLALSFSQSLLLSPLSLPFLPLYCFQAPSVSRVSFALFNGLHMSAKWPWHCCDKVKCPSAPSHAVPPGVRSQGSAYSTQPQASADPPVQTTLSRSPFVSRPAGPLQLPPLISAEKTDTLGS